MLLRHVRLVPVGGYAVPTDPVDLRLDGNQILAVGPQLPAWRGEDILDAQGRWAIPGLWDQHVHMLQWALMQVRVNTGGSKSAEEVATRVSDFIKSWKTPDPQRIVVGFGHRMAEWDRTPTTQELDDVSGEVPVILISGDAHSGWLNSSAMRRLAVAHQDGPLVENDWFPVMAEMSRLPQLVQQHEEAYVKAITDAHSMGVVGIVDLEFEMGYAEWARRYYNGIRTMRVRTAIYEDNLDGVIAANLRTGDPLVGTDGMIHMGPFKIISDGSLNTKTAYCCEPYVSTEVMKHPHGKPNQTYAHLRDTLQRACDHGLDIALHAIGDQAVSDALGAFEETGAKGTIEHAQLMRWQDIPRMATMGVMASVQPAHLLDDRDTASRCWPGRTDRCFPLASLLRAGVPLLFGSDAPIAPLDPWLAMAAAVHRSADDRDPWNPREALTVPQALAASTDRQTTLQLGSRPDVVLLDADPLAEAGDSKQTSDHLKSMPVAATIVAGKVVWSAEGTFD